ncbi:hypothetical protein ScPMuIL_017396 [Solemya velum]
MIRYFLLAAGVGLAYYLYTPLPSYSPEPWKVQMLVHTSKLMYMVADLAEFIGYDTSLNITRWQMKMMYNDDATDEELLISDDMFDGVTVRIYRPKSHKGLMPAVVYYPGCGFVMNGLVMHHQHSIALAKETNTVVVTAQHRLAPEHPFPAAIEDSMAVLNYVMTNAESFGIDKKRVGVLGDSSGANVAVAVAMEHKSSKDVPNLKFLIMAYPSLQSLDLKTIPHGASRKPGAPVLIHTRRTIEYMMFYIFGFDGAKYVDDFLANNHTHYSLQKSKYAEYVNLENLPEKERKLYANETQILGSRKDPLSLEITKKILDPLVSGLMASDEQLQRLPPILHITCEYDFALLDGLLFNTRLEKLGIDLVHLHYRGYPHGFIIPLNFLNGARNAWTAVVNFAKEKV